MDFALNYSLADNFLDELFRDALEKNNNLSFVEVQRHKDFIANYVKALVARNIWRERGFYFVYNRRDKLFNKALETVNRNTELAINGF